MNLTMVISSLSSGGAERVMTTMANYWAAKGWNVRILTSAGPAEKPFYRLSERVACMPLGIAGESKSVFQAVRNNLLRLRTLAAALRTANPDAIISFLPQENVLTILASRTLRCPVIVSERTNPGARNLGLFWNVMRSMTYRRADAVVVQTRAVQDFFNGPVRKLVRVIPNPVVAPPPASEAPPSSEKRQLVAVGRLGQEKGFDLLIDVFDRLAGRFPNWNLVIWGEGDQRAKLERQVKKLKLGSRVELPGRTENVHKELRQAHIFVLTSHFEGFPNALCEAMSVGLPVASFDCPHGPRDIVRHGIDGLLVPPGDAEGLSKALAQLMGDERKRLEFGFEAANIVKRFPLDGIMGQWEQLLVLE